MDAVTPRPPPSAAGQPRRALPPLPPESPLPMSVQTLGHGALVNPSRPTTPPNMAWRRFAVIGAAVLLTAIATYQLWWLLRGDGIDPLEGTMLVLFVALFAWIVQAFVGAVAGFVLLLQRRPLRMGMSAQGPLPAVSTRTALLVPIYNEDPERLMAGLQAMHESLAATGQLDRFDFFVLSDTRKADIQAAEAAAFLALHDRLGADARVFYRLRDDNSERKAGNIADWVRRWGGAWPQFLILDADSVMDGGTIVRLAAAMERHDDVALIQTLPVIVNGNTLFARMQQFAGRVYGPVIAYGVAWWHGAESNYWGHNAMIRTRAFAECAGLPELHGVKPFAGTVLSHDFVEAALMRRGGWALHMIPGLGGSYEEGPPSLTDMLVRDRRWCQGNLQHGAVLPARGLHWVSRWHLLIGIGHYFTAPMWAMLMLVGVAIPLLHAGFSWDQFSLAGFTPTEYWREQDSSRFIGVFVVTMTMLLAPKLMGWLATVTDPAMRRGCGGAWRTFVGMLLETLLAALMAPVTMWVQSRGVAEVLAGKDSGWESQRRDDGTLSLRELLRLYGGLSVAGVVAGVATWMVSPALAAWMSPVVLGLVLAIPIVALGASRTAGQWLRRRRIFATPEELAPPPVLVRATALRALHNGAPTTWSAAMPLECIERETGPEPAWSIVWLHGLGADGGDFVPVVPELVRPDWPALRFVFPHAPVRPVTINNRVPMRAWYDIVDIDLDNRADEAGVAESVEQVEALIAREAGRGVPRSRVLLAGFSQGGAVTLAAGLRSAEPLAGLVALSTYVPSANKAREALAEGAQRQPVFMGHGSQDPVVPFQAGQQSAALLRELGFEVDWHAYPMPHSVCAEEIRDLGDWLARRFAAG